MSDSVPEDWIALRAAELGEARSRLSMLATRWRGQPWWSALVEEAPGPIAHEVEAFATVLESGDSGGGLLQLRDTIETLLKFLTLIFARDLIVNGRPPDVEAVHKTLFVKFLAIGDWRDALQNFTQRILTRHGSYPSVELSEVVHSTNLLSMFHEFLRFRNDEIGHGAFRRDPREAVKILEMAVFHPRGGIASILAAAAKLSWPKIELLHEGNWIGLTGADSVRCWHQAASRVSEDSRTVLAVRATFGDKMLDLAPFIAGRVCIWCRHQDIFIFDSLHDRRNGGRFDFLDYVQGHKMRSRDPDLGGILQEMHQESATLKLALDWGTIDADAVTALETAANDIRYLRPTYLYDAVIERLHLAPTGLTWLQAPAHVGKSVFMRAIADTQADIKDRLPVEHLAVAGLFIKREWQAKLALLQDLLIDSLMHGLSIAAAHRHKLPKLDESALDKPAAFVALLETAIGLSRMPGLLLVIDGLDELDPSPDGLVFADFIPSAEMLPKSVHVLLSSRPPRDQDCPDWVGLRLLPRIEQGAAILRVSLEDRSYHALLFEYTRRLLGRDPDPDTFQLLLDKSECRFLYVSFLVEQLAGRHLNASELKDAPRGEELHRCFLFQFKAQFGWRRLAEEAELLLLAVAAEELAHEWGFGSGLEFDGSGPMLLADSVWQGSILDALGRLLDRIRQDGELETTLIYALLRMRTATAISRSGKGEAKFRIWLKGVTRIMSENPEWAMKLRLMHERLALAGAEWADECLESSKESQKEKLFVWANVMPRLWAHAMLSGSDSCVVRLRDTDSLLNAASKVSMYAQALDARYSLSQYAANVALTVLRARANEKHGQLSGDDIEIYTGALQHRGRARMLAGDASAARKDFASAIFTLIEIQKNIDSIFEFPFTADLADLNLNMGAAFQQDEQLNQAVKANDQAILLYSDVARRSLRFTETVIHGLCTGYMNRGLAKGSLGDFDEAALDLDESIHLRRVHLNQLSGDTLDTYINELAGVLVNRATMITRDNLESRLRLIDEAIELRTGLRTSMKGDFPPPWGNSLALTFMARSKIHHSLGNTIFALKDARDGIELHSAMRIVLGQEYPDSWLKKLAEMLGWHGELLLRINDRSYGIGELNQAISILNGLKLNTKLSFPLNWAIELAELLLVRGEALEETGNLEAAITDVEVSFEICADVFQQLSPGATPRLVNLLEAGMKARDRLRHLLGKEKVQSGDWRFESRNAADLIISPSPSPLMPTLLSEVPRDMRDALWKSILDVLGDQNAKKLFLVFADAQPCMRGAVLVWFLLADYERRPRVLDALMFSDGVSLITPQTDPRQLASELLKMLGGALEVADAVGWTSLFLAGPWTSHPRKLIASTEAMPWLDGQDHGVRLPEITVPRLIAVQDGFVIEAFWICECKLMRGTIAVKFDGRIEIMSEIFVTEKLPIKSWTYEESFRVVSE